MSSLYARFFRFLLRLVLGILLLSVLITLAFRWIPIPVSALMLIRSGEQTSAEKPIKMNYRWVNLSDISPQLQKAVIAAEDQRFYSHWGFDFEAIEKAVEHNKVSKAKRGASTISQQTAKNLFLWPGRSYVRKSLEAYFTLIIELVWPKDRILEVYLNIAEWGDGIYGAEAAARAYFDKTADKLTLVESARLAACLPSPRKWSPARPNPYVIARTGAIVFKVKQMEANRLLDEVSQEVTGAAPADDAAPRRIKLRSADSDTTESAEAPSEDDSAPPTEAADSTGGMR